MTVLLEYFDLFLRDIGQKVGWGRQLHHLCIKEHLRPLHVVYRALFPPPHQNIINPKIGHYLLYLGFPI